MKSLLKSCTLRQLDFVFIIYLLLTEMVNLCLVDFVVTRFQTNIISIYGYSKRIFDFLFIYLIFGFKVCGSILRVKDMMIMGFL